MTSLIAWLDASSEDQRRMREIVRLFSQQESRDELGVGQIRDALSDLLFPGTSTLHTRARYLLFIPWCFRVAAERSTDAEGLPTAVDRVERQLIAGIRASRDAGGDVNGLLGASAGEALRVLPSTVYWSALRTYGILNEASMDQQDALTAEYARRRNRAQLDDDDGSPTSRHFGAWAPTLPSVPTGFPSSVPGGFALTSSGAAWLREHMQKCAPDTLLSHVLDHRPSQTNAPWEDPSTVCLPPEPRRLLDHAQRFSYLMHGAALLYNVMLAEAYEHAGNIRQLETARSHRAALDAWASDRYESAALQTWDIDDFWATVMRQNSHVRPQSRAFVNAWLRVVREGESTAIADNDGARKCIDKRERTHKFSQARLHNVALLSQWSGASGAARLTYRWTTVRDIVIDIHNGLERADA